MIDSLLDTDALTRQCRLIFEGSKRTPCENCVYDPIGQKSSGRYKSGGPWPFHGGICPMCAGDGFTTDRSTEDIYLAVIYDEGKWKKLGAGNASTSRTPETVKQFIQTMSKTSTWPQINRANSIIIDVDLIPYKEMMFQKVGDPEICGFGDSRYILATWERV